MKDSLLKLLPGYNCGRCGFPNCTDFANALITSLSDFHQCPFLEQKRFESNVVAVQKLINHKCLLPNEEQKIIGVIDGYEADIVLKPLKSEYSCREVLMPTSLINIEQGDIVEYRPLGCPIVHYGKVLEIDNLLITVHLIGPCLRKNQNLTFKSIGCCLIIAFVGRYQGKDIKVGETIRFLPDHCMMQKVHSGVVVNIEAETIRLEGIDLKIWSMPTVDKIEPTKT
jgi:hypothetical protein